MAEVRLVGVEAMRRPAVVRPQRLHLHLGAAHGVPHRLGVLLDSFAHHHLLHHPRLLAHHRLLIGFGDLDRPLPGGREIRLGGRPVHRVPLDADLSSRSRTVSSTGRSVTRV